MPNAIAQTCGTFGCDILPYDETGVMVANTDPHDKTGEHWTVIYASPDGKHGEYFDLIGHQPPPVFETYLNDNCLIWTDSHINCNMLSARCVEFAYYHDCIVYIRVIVVA